MVLLKKYNNIIPLFRLCFYVAQEKITFTVFLVFFCFNFSQFRKLTKLVKIIVRLTFAYTSYCLSFDTQMLYD